MPWWTVSYVQITTELPFGQRLSLILRAPSSCQPLVFGLFGWVVLFFGFFPSSSVRAFQSRCYNNSSVQVKQDTHVQISSQGLHSGLMLVALCPGNHSSNHRFTCQWICNGFKVSPIDKPVNALEFREISEVFPWQDQRVLNMSCLLRGVSVVFTLTIWLLPSFPSLI